MAIGIVYMAAYNDISSPESQEVVRELEPQVPRDLARLLEIYISYDMIFYDVVIKRGLVLQLQALVSRADPGSYKTLRVVRLS